MKYDRSFNFNAGPAALPEEVLEKAHSEWFNYKGSGMSVMEMSHRSKEFSEIHQQTKNNIIELLAIPDDYAVLFLQGGASMQFAMLPTNLAGKDQAIDMIQTGSWTKKATAEAKRITSVNEIASTADKNFTELPGITDLKASPNAAYVHICSNNTIFGTQFKSFPATGDIPLVADMSSDILSRPLNVKDFGVIFAGAQKNLGPSGVTLVIIRKDLAERADEKLPKIWQYRTFIETDSLYNTPPAYGIYMIGLVAAHIKSLGGLEKMQEVNERKAKKLYDFITSNDFYLSPIKEADRSNMNVVFRIKAAVEDEAKESLEAAFVKEATAAGLAGLKGHRSIGGLRASIYNAHPEEGIDALVKFMEEFADKNKG